MDSNSINEIVICTSNQGKVIEFKHILSTFGIHNIKFHTITDFKPYINFDPEETEDNYIGNATIKAQAGSKICQTYCLADDSGISVEALNGRPGIFSGRYLRNSDKGISGLLEEMENIENRKCHYTCALVLCNSQGEVVFTTENYWYGLIAFEPRGIQGFGFDPIVHPWVDKTNNYDMSITVAELTDTEKNSMSHRKLSLEKLANFLQT